MPQPGLLGAGLEVPQPGLLRGPVLPGRGRGLGCLLSGQRWPWAVRLQSVPCAGGGWPCPRAPGSEQPAETRMGLGLREQPCQPKLPGTVTCAVLGAHWPGVSSHQAVFRCQAELTALPRCPSLVVTKGRLIAVGRCSVATLIPSYCSDVYCHLRCCG